MNVPKFLDAYQSAARSRASPPSLRNRGRDCSTMASPGDGGGGDERGDQMPAWRRTLQTIFLSQILTLVGFSCVFPFFPLFIQTLGVRGSWGVLRGGVSTLAGSSPPALAPPIGGPLADRYGRKPMLVRAM